MITLKKLSVSIEEKKILHDIAYTFEKDKIYAVMGPNGSGKSTLAYAIMGHPAYSLGKKSEIYYGSKNITEFSADERAEEGVFLG